jgi:hypothetical protein
MLSSLKEHYLYSAKYHEGISPHFSHQLHNWLKNHFLHTQISHGCLIIWPPHSPDLNPIDFSCGNTSKKVSRLQKYKYNKASTAQSVGYRLDDQGLIPSRGKKFSSFPWHPDWHWGLTSLLYNGYQGLNPHG